MMYLGPRKDKETFLPRASRVELSHADTLILANETLVRFLTHRTLR